MPAAIPLIVQAGLTYAGVNAGVVAVATLATTVAVGSYERSRAEKKSRDAYNKSLSDRLLTIRSGVSTRKYVLGTARVGGTLLYADTIGTNQIALDMVRAHSANTTNLVGWYIDDEYVAAGSFPGTKYGGRKTLYGRASQVFSTGGAKTIVLPDTPVSGTVRAWVVDTEVQLSVTVAGNGVSFTLSSAATVEVAYSYMGAASMYGASTSGTSVQSLASWGANYPSPLWGGTHQAKGTTLTRTLMLWDEDVYQSGAPEISPVLTGIGVARTTDTGTWYPYDPRTDTPVMTGTTNPALLAAWWMTLPREHRGCGIPEDWIDWDSVAAAANVCDELITVRKHDGSGYEQIKRYECNTVLDTADAPIENLEIILSAMAGKRAFTAGKYRILAGAFRSATLTITDDMTVGTEPITVLKSTDASPPNTVTAKIADATKHWQETSPPQVVNATYLLADGGERSFDLPLPATTDPRQANYLMGLELERRRPAMRCTLHVGGAGEDLALYDTVQLDLTNRSQYVGKTFEIVRITDKWNGTFDLTLVETKATTYALDADRFTPINQPAPPDLSYYWNVAPLDGFDVLDGQISDGIEIAWDLHSQSYVRDSGWIELRYRRLGESTWRLLPQAAGDSTGTTLSLALIADATYEFQARAVNRIGATSPWAYEFATVVAATGPSLNFIGEFATPPSVSGLPEGSVYRNSTDKDTYVLRSGSWQLFLEGGEDGAPGTAKLLRLLVTSSVFQVSQTGTGTPASITLTAQGQNLAGSPTFTVTSGTVTGGLLGTGQTRTLNYSAMTTDSVTVQVTQDGLSDQVTILKVFDGSSAIASVLTNEAHTIPADYEGDILAGALTDAVTLMKVYRGGTDDTANWSFSRVDSGVTSTLTTSGADRGKVAITAMPGDSGYVDITATRSTFPNQVKRFVLSKSKQGAVGDAGAGAKLLALAASSQVFQIMKSGSNNPASITFTATSQNLSGSLSWSITGGTLTGSGSSRTLTFAAMTGETATVTVTSSLDGVSDSVTVVKLREGADGNAGLSTATVMLFRRSASTPAVPSTTATYTFATGVLTGHNNNWTQTAPAADGNPLWVTIATASGTGSTDTLAPAEWASAAKIAQDGTNGTDGVNGLNTAVVTLYKRGSTSPSLPSGTFTYTFSSGVLSGGTPNGWTQAVPAANGDPLWVIQASAAAQTATDSIAAAEFSSPIKFLQDGTNGTNGLNGLNFSEAKSLFTDPTFQSGLNTVSSYKWEELPGTTSVTVVREAKQTDSPFADSGFNIKITSWGNSTTSPIARHGFSQLTTSRASAVFVHRIIAKFPVGYSIGAALNATGDGRTITWLTSRSGTGKFEEYIYVLKCGSTGTFDSFGYIYIIGPTATEASPLVWYLAFAAVYDFTAIGFAAITAILSNTAHAVPTDSAGNNGVYTYAASTMYVYNGASDDSANWSVSATPSSGVSGSLAGKTYTVSGMTQDSGYVDFTATRAGYSNVTARFTVTKAKQGAAGQSATSYWLVTDAVAIKKDQLGAYSPTSITVSAKSQAGAGSPAAYAGRFIIATSSDGTTFSDKYTSGSDQSSYTYSVPVAIKLIRTRLYLAGGVTNLLDEQITPIVSDGAAGLNSATVMLFRRSATTPALPSTTATYTFSTGALTGHNNSWTQAVPAADGNPLWMTLATASSTGSTDTIPSGEWAAAAKVAQDGSTGSAGANSAVVTLYKRGATTPSAPSGTFTYTFASGVLSGGTPNGWTQAVPTADGNPLWVIQASAVGSGTTDTIAAAEFSGATKFVQDGAAGADAVASLLTNESHTVAADSAGVVTSGLPVSVDMDVYVGLIDDTINWSFTRTNGTGVTSSINNTAGNSGRGRLTVTALTVDSSTVTITATKTGYPTQTKTFTISKSRQGTVGTAGSDGTRGSAHAYLSGYSAWNQTPVDAYFTSTYGGKVVNDMVTVYGAAFSQTRLWTGSSWGVVTQAHDGTMLIDGTVPNSAMTSLASHGMSITPDPGFEDLSLWTFLQTAATRRLVSWNRFGRFALRGEGASCGVISKPVPIDNTRNYRAIAVLNAAAGSTRVGYTMVVFYDASGVVIAGSADSAGWPTSGAYHYFGLQGTQPPEETLTEYSTMFGPAHPYKIPAAARSAAIGALLHADDGIPRTGNNWLCTARIQQLQDTELLAPNAATDVLVIRTAGYSVPAGGVGAGIRVSGGGSGPDLTWTNTLGEPVDIVVRGSASIAVNVTNSTVRVGAVAIMGGATVLDMQTAVTTPAVNGSYQGSGAPSYSTTVAAGATVSYDLRAGIENTGVRGPFGSDYIVSDGQITLEVIKR